MKTKNLTVCIVMLSISASPALAADRQYDPQELAAGKALYQNNCAECHGAEAEGAANWHQADANGKYPPPPLNGTAHTWHHPATALFRTIGEGTEALGGSMPAGKDKLSQEEILLIINWITSLWPDEIYDAWSKRN